MAKRTALPRGKSQPAAKGEKKIRGARRKRAAARPPVPSTDVTLASLWEFLAPGMWRYEVLLWPPDVFALVGAVLERTGGYRYVVSKHWPPAPPAQKGAKMKSPAGHSGAWPRYMRDVGARWRWAVAQPDPMSQVEQFPTEILEWWGTAVRFAARTGICQLEARIEKEQRSELLDTLLQLWAAADEACAGAGLPYDPRLFSNSASYLNFLREADDCLMRPRGPNQPATLCRAVKSGEVIVLPKLHTPQCGVTLRSLSHHLAFTSMREVVPVWRPLTSKISSIAPGTTTMDGGHSLNLLLLPWPEEIDPVAFSPADAVDRGHPPHRRFNYAPPHRADRAARLEAALKRATAMVGRVDGVVLPELSMESSAATRELATILWRTNPSGLFIAGVGEMIDGVGVNKAVVHVKAGDSELEPLEQEKHHRWQLDRAQIEQYGLGGRLDPFTSWWENTRIGRRRVGFMTLRPWLTMTVLICEDLARQEPVAEVVRAVGPNLVIALLMDGPQLCGRWPARYATVLAEDPGSSVLTLTSIGMAKLCRPGGIKPSRVIGLWKDRNRAPTEIELPDKAVGVVLSLTYQPQTERSLDHRDDGGGSYHLYLGGCHGVFIDEPKNSARDERNAAGSLTRTSSGP
jgi:hypothetical protein